MICMPVTTPGIKVGGGERLGATVALEGENYDACREDAKRRAEEEGRDVCAAV